MIKWYRRNWHRNTLFSVFSHLRDLIVNIIPVRRLPAFIVKILYGFSPDFIFLIHPRRVEDLLVGEPYFKILRKILPARLFLWYVTRTPAYSIGKMISSQGLKGLLVTNAILPKYMLRSRRTTLRNVKCILGFLEKISKDRCYVGLGAWWPIVSRRGLIFKKYANNRIDWNFTNGHCGTLASIYLMVKKIADIGGLRHKDIDLAIIGAGKMGTAVAKALAGKVKKISLIDKNPMRLDRALHELNENNNTSAEVELFHVTSQKGLKDALSGKDISVCTTSNISSILNGFELPGNSIVIDDARPEAFSRETGGSKSIVLEGGLLKIDGFSVNYDFGFGMDENVFGCLAEVFALTLDHNKNIAPTLGDVDMGNFDNIIEFFSKNGIHVGDFKSNYRKISDEERREVCRNAPVARHARG